MKRKICFFLLPLLPHAVFAQQEQANEAGIENQQDVVEATGNTEIPLPDDEQDYTIDLNAPDAAAILQSPLFSPAQAQAILRHRTGYGRLLQAEELQVLDEFDTATIRRLRPYLICSQPVLDERFLPAQVLASARHELLLRWRRNPDERAGFGDDGQYPFFTGDPNQYFLRYRLHSGQHLRAGVVMEKDAGEKLFSRASGGRVDFFSWHVFLRPNTRLRQLALGDYQVQFGQGLVAWNGISLGKSSEVHQVYRRGAGFRPYCAAGESGFYRGIAIATGTGKQSLHAWLSYRKLDATLFPADSTFSAFEVSSVGTTGLHRTPDEIKRKAVLGQWVAGAHWQLEHGRWRHEGTAQYTGYEYPLWPGDDPYEVFDPAGRHFLAVGYAARYLLPNGSIYGEAAIDKEGDPGVIAGWVLMPDRAFTLSMQARSYARDFHSPGGDALREGSSVRNEQGLYTGFQWQLQQPCRLQGYLDVFRFPWLRYTTSAPATGKEWLLQFTWLPLRTTEVYLRFRQEEKPTDMARLHTEEPVTVVRRNIRFHSQWQSGKHTELHLRAEWVEQRQAGSAASGMLFYQEARYRPMGKPYSLSLRWLVFRTSGYESRIYSYEQDVAGAFSLPAYAGEGSRWYVLCRYRLPGGFDVWLRYGRTVYFPSVTEPQPAEQEIKAQVRWQF